MARTARTPPADSGGEYKKPDAHLAFRIYDGQIKAKKAQAKTIRGDLSEPYQQIKDQAHFPRRVLDFIVALDGMEDAKRDHHLLALAAGLAERKLFMPRDLVTIADGQDGAAIVPSGKAATKPRLVTVPAAHPADDSDLVDAAQGGEAPAPRTGAAARAAMKAAGSAEAFDEASDEELAAQEGRGGRVEEDA